MFGFRHDTKKAEKYLGKVKTTPPQNIFDSSKEERDRTQSGNEQPSGDKRLEANISADNAGEPAKQTAKSVICISCKQTKPQSAYSSSQWKRPASSRSCIACCEKKTFVPDEGAMKKCFSCRVEKSKADFTTSQWRQPVGTGRCSSCSADDDKPKTETIQPNQATFGTTAPNNTKPCFECNQEKAQADFTASQWKKRRGTGKCIACVSKTIQWQTGSVGTSLQLKPCGECGIDKPHAMFSPNQWRRTVGTGRCKECVSKSLPY